MTTLGGWWSGKGRTCTDKGVGVCPKYYGSAKTASSKRHKCMKKFDHTGPHQCRYCRKVTWT